MWTEHPYANIGLPTGIAFDVVDIEAQNVERFEALCREHGVNLDDFPRARSGRGGLHLYVAPTGFGSPITGLGDLKGSSGYVVAPPSSLILGRAYQWIKEPDGTFPPCPPFLLQLLAGRRRAEGRFSVGLNGQTFESAPPEPVDQRQRYTADSPCPICGGHQDGRHGPGEGAGMHCWGFVSNDGKYAVCTRVETAGALELNPNTQGYHHLLVGGCGCGEVHGDPEDEFKPTVGLSSNVQTASLEPNYGLLVMSGPELLAGAAHLHDLHDLPFLPLLSIDGYFVKGWSHLVSGYPRVGKTDLLLACCRQWLRMGERVLYITEEPVTIWQHRLKMWSGDWTNLQVAFGLGADPTLLRKLAREGAATLVVVDALRNLLGLKDEKDNSEIARVVNPWVADSRAVEKTLFVAHHQRKGGGEHGEGISGGHALMGAFDIPIEVLWDPSKGTNRRLVRTYPRLIEAKEGLYEKVADGEFEYVGDPQAVALVEVTDTARSLLTDAWQSTDDIWAGMDEPKPSKEQVRKALTDLAKQRVALRDPSIDSGPARGRTHRWKRPGAGSSEASATGSELSSNNTVYTLEPNSDSAPTSAIATADLESEEMKAAEAERQRRRTMFK